MPLEDAYELDFDSDLFISLCAKLNGMVRKAGATWVTDILAGAFKFDDEIPQEVNDVGAIKFALSLITRLRCLWAYRMSLVEGKPRAELAATWESAKALAPLWAGFAPDRCSPEMQPVVEDVSSKMEEFDQDVERLEARIEERMREGGT